MKIKIIVLFTFILCSISSFAQDVIFKKNGDEIKCKVTEVSLTQINYQLRDSVDSTANSAQILSIEKQEVFMIKYKNGTKDIFNESENKEADYVAPKVVEREVESDRIEVNGKKYFYHNRRLAVNKLYSLLRKEKNKDINNLVTRSVICSVFSPVLLYASIPVGVVGIIILGVSSDTNSGNNNQDVVNGSLLTGAFVLAQVGGYVVKGFQNKNLKKAVELYNQNHK